MNRWLFFLITLCLSTQAWAQESNRPKVGLVLSGGGAKGFAHIGVLKVLEEEGVKIDYIGGTSMGAIIGSLYAAGYSAHQLDSIFKTIDTDALVQDYIPRKAKSFYEKRNDEIYAIQLPFDQFKIGAPTALSKGMYNYNLLSRLLGHVRHVNDFNHLDIPFFCIATDVVTGEQVILNSGVLPQSVLASGAFPSLYSPVEINGKILIDGGVVNNYPIDEVRKMGADIIIGVDVQDGLKTRKEIKGATDILMQIANYGMYKGMDEKAKNTDIYIKPDISNYSVVTFDKGTEIIDKGTEATLKHIDKIRKLSSNYTRSPLPIDEVFDTISLHKIEVNSLKYYNKDYVLGKLNHPKEGCVPFADLETGINNLNATQNFTGINYKFLKNNDTNDDVLVLSLVESPHNRFLKFGLHYDHLYKSSLLINVTQKKLFTKNDVASLDFVVGDNVRYFFNYFLDNGFRWSYGFQSKWGKFKNNIRSQTHEIIPFVSTDVYNFVFHEWTNRIFLQNYYKNRFQVGLGLEHKFHLIDVTNVQMTSAWIDNSHYLIPYMNILLDTYDNKYFPTKGVRFSSELKHHLLSSDYNNNFEPFSQFTAELGLVKTFFDKFSIEFFGDIGFTVGSEPSSNHHFFHGGYGFNHSPNLKSFYGYDFLSLNADSYLKARLTIDYRVKKNHHFNFSANFAQIGNSMFETTDWIDLPKRTGYALGYGLQTVIGPIEIKQSYSPEVDKHFTWFSVGFWF